MFETRVTIVGVGNIGAAIVSTWLKAGYQVTMWNRNPTRPALKTLAAKGAIFEPDIKAAISRSDLILLCVANYDNIKEILTNAFPGDHQSPKAIFNITTGTPQQARDLEVWLKAKSSVTYYDGAIMVTPELIGTDYSTIYLGGENESRFKETSSFLEPLGKLRYISEDPGAASLWDLAALAAMDGMFLGGFWAMNLLKRQRSAAGVDESLSVEQPMREIVLPLLTAFLPHLADIANALDKEDWAESFGNTVSMQLKGLQTIVEGFEQEKVNVDGLKMFQALMQRVQKEKGDDAGLAAIGTMLLED
ncbi:hypothetical protein ACJ41O_014917 [Fusarium nematophilum]